MRRKRSSIALALAGVFLSGCALLGRGTGDDPFDATGRDGPVMIEVQNDNFSDARIYALWSGTRQRIGTVAGNTRETLDVEWRGPDLRIEVDFIAAGGFVTDPTTVWPGDRVFLRIPSNQ